eukprot:1679120-Pleurochrysis_carterae.AAC.5
MAAFNRADAKLARVPTKQCRRALIYVSANKVAATSEYALLGESCETLTLYDMAAPLSVRARTQALNANAQLTAQAPAAERAETVQAEEPEHWDSRYLSGLRYSLFGEVMASIRNSRKKKSSPCVSAYRLTEYVFLMQFIS